MQIVVEFYGIPGQRAGVSRTVVERPGADVRLADVWRTLANRFPRFAEECLVAGRLRGGYLANLGGNRFVTDPRTLLKDGDALLIMSADAGG
jgi:sulfur-carrier protein